MRCPSLSELRLCVLTASGVSYVYRRASFDTSVPGAKRRCLNDGGEDPEEDVEEQRVSEH